MSLKLTFEIAFKADYHVGAGYGKGFGLDSALLREADGRPVLRGSTVVGLLRGSAYRLLELPPLQRHHRDKVLAQLFGAPAQAKRWHIGSARPATRQVEDSQPVQRVRIDPRTRRAEPRKLFSQEEGNAGQVFRFTATCAANDDAALDDAALLLAVARNVRQLGRSRRRGLGECVIHLTNVDGIEAGKAVDQSWDDWFLMRFDRAWMRGNPAQLSKSGAIPPVKVITVSGGAAVRMRLIVRLDEPLIIAERAPAGNQYDSRPYVPGGAVLGTLAGLAAERCDLSAPDEYHRFVALFLRGGVTFAMLYPANEYRDNLYPTIPVPLGLMTCSVVPFEGKSEGHSAYPAGKHKECPQCGSRLEPVSGFAVLKRDGPYTRSPGRSSELHIQLNEKTQRVEKGQLYGYSVLNAGQYFVGELFCADEATWMRLQEMTGIAEKTPLTWRIGKARRRGYGQVSAWLERYDGLPQTCVQLPLAERVKDDPMQLVSLTLLSDTIIADPWGRQAAGFAPEWLEAALDLGLLKIEDAYARTRVVDSFNAHLGLSRWRDTALTAGAVVWIRLLAPPDDWTARIQRLEAEGIGLRRNEGFGRIAFNHPVYDLCQDIQNSAIALDPQIRSDHAPGRDTFMGFWEEELKKHLSQNQRLDARFAALARWLHTHSNESPQALLNRLNAIGQPDTGLKEAIGGPEEYGQLSKTNFFQADGKKGIEAIDAALKHLHEKEERQNWSPGIERLAEWLAALAGEKQQGGAQ